MILEEIILPVRDQPIMLAWPCDGQASGLLQFDHPDQWRAFVESLEIHPIIPTVVAAKFARGQALYLLGWFDSGLIKAGDLAALVALELALTDRYGGAYKKKPRFSALLKYMVKPDGLTEADIPMVVRCNGALGQRTGETHPTLVQRRNNLAHGAPFEGWPTAGLLELVRDLINFAYRGYIAEAEA